MDKTTLNKIAALLAGPLLFVLILLLGNSSSVQIRMLAIAAWMLSWWITQAVPIGVTALLPLVLFPLCGIESFKLTAVNYSRPVIFLFLGGFILGLAIEKWYLHKRIAINLLRISGSKPSSILLGFMAATALLSMWISNTATTVMMLPIGLSVIALLKNSIDDGKDGKNFALTLLLGLAYSANIGGMATLIGTPPNLVLAGIVQEQLQTEITFINWLGFALPLVILLLVLAYLVNTYFIYPVKIKKLAGARELIDREWKKLGKPSTGEKRVIAIFTATALMWIFRSPLSRLPGLENISDPMIAVIASVLLFAFPAGKNNGRLLEWEDTTRLPWGIILLFGGGLALAKGLEVTRIINLIGDWISQSNIDILFVLILVVAAFSIFLTEIMSNVALVTVFIPISLIIAKSFNVPELQLAIPLTLGASCAFMLPIATPPNAIVFASKKIKMQEMIRAGFVLNFISLLVISLYVYLFYGAFF